MTATKHLTTLPASFALVAPDCDPREDEGGGLTTDSAVTRPERGSHAAWGRKLARAARVPDPCHAVTTLAAPPPPLPPPLPPPPAAVGLLSTHAATRTR